MSKIRYIKGALDISFEETARFNASLIEQDASGTLLDIGAYKGLMKQHLPPGMHYTGVDLQDWGRGDIREVDLNRSELPFPEDSFDIVVAANVIEHLLIHPEQILRDIHRVLKPGGIAILSFPNDRGLSSLTLGAAGLIRLFKGVNPLKIQEFGHHWMFDEKTARFLAEGFFSVKKIIPHPGVILKKIPLLNRIKLLTSDIYLICLKSGPAQT